MTRSADLGTDRRLTYEEAVEEAGKFHSAAAALASGLLVKNLNISHSFLPQEYFSVLRRPFKVLLVADTATKKNLFNFR